MVIYLFNPGFKPFLFNIISGSHGVETFVVKSSHFFTRASNTDQRGDWATLFVQAFIGNKG